MTAGGRDPYVERRRAPRLENLGRLHARLLTGTTKVTLHDISTGGFSVVSDMQFTVGDVHRFAIKAQSSPPVELTARVAYCRPFFLPRDKDQFFTGFAFTRLDARARQDVDRLLDQLTSTLSFE